MAAAMTELNVVYLAVIVVTQKKGVHTYLRVLASGNTQYLLFIKTVLMVAAMTELNVVYLAIFEMTTEQSKPN